MKFLTSPTLNGQKLTGVADPTVPTDAATKGYVDTADNLRLLKTSNLADLASAATARINLGLGNVDNTPDNVKPVSGPQANADALALQASANLGDLTSTITARSNLGILSVGTTFGTVAAGDDSRFTDAWTAYTPVLTAITTNPTLGSASARASRWVQIGKTVIYEGYIRVGGAGFAAGSGIYLVSLPVTAVSDGMATPRLGAVQVIVGAKQFVYMAYRYNTTNFAMYGSALYGGSPSSVTDTIPAAMVASTTFDWSITYEAA